MTDVFAMGTYAAFVWPAYGLSLAAIGGLVWLSLRARRAARRLVASLDPPSPSDGVPAP